MRTDQPPSTLVLVQGRPSVRFERSFPCPATSLWRAVTEPAELQRWFPSTIEWTPTVGECFVVDGVASQVLELHPETLVVWKAGVEHYRFEIAGESSACTFAFVHGFDAAAASAAQYAGGWEGYLERLRVHLLGGYLTEEAAHMQMAGAQDRYDVLFATD